MKVLLCAVTLAAVITPSVIAAKQFGVEKASVVAPRNVGLKKFEQREISDVAVVAQVDGSVITRESIAGLIAALATLPTSISYAAIVGLNPLVGVWTTVILGTVMSLVGGAPGVVAGAAGVVAIPMAKLMATHGSAYMSAAVLFAGLLKYLFGFFKLGKIVGIVEEPVVAGFLNAFAVFLVKSQLKNFYYNGAWLPSAKLLPTAVITALTFALIFIVPKITSAVPASLVAISVATILSEAFKLPLKTLQDVGGKAAFAGGLSVLPSFKGLPPVPLSMETLQVIAPVSAGVAVICLVETLLASKITSAQFRSKMPGYQPDDPDKASMGNGLGTIAAGLFGGFGGCGLIPNTILLGKSGGVTRLASFSVGAVLTLFIMVAAPVIAKIPMAALAGLMFSVAINTVEWKESQHLIEHSSHGVKGALDLVAMIVTMALCYQVDMGIGVFVGVLITQIVPLMKLLGMKV